MVLSRHLQALRRLGFKEYLRQLWFLREVRGGTLVGSDRYGNRYFEMVDIRDGNTLPKSLSDPVSCFSINSSTLPFYRCRYVELADGSDEASKVPPEWHGWLHYTNDDAPSRNPEAYITPSWAIPHTQNLTGGPLRYIPYSTTVKRVQVYSPPNLLLNRAFILGNYFLRGEERTVQQQSELTAEKQRKALSQSQ